VTTLRLYALRGVPTAKLAEKSRREIMVEKIMIGVGEVAANWVGDLVDILCLMMRLI